jgi:DnaJ-class molecular chaperone
MERVSPVAKMDHMKKSREVVSETICPACNGIGVPKVKQPAVPGRKIYPAACTQCLGKGRIRKP